MTAVSAESFDDHVLAHKQARRNPPRKVAEKADKVTAKKHAGEKEGIRLRFQCSLIFSYDFLCSLPLLAEYKCTMCPSTYYKPEDLLSHVERAHMKQGNYCL
jgi:hypothetical protein